MSIWIPVCTGITSTPHAEKEDEYTAYVVEYKQNGVEKAVVKRFSEFFTFDSFLRQRGFCCLPALPSRTLIKLFVDSFVQDRLRQLNEYVVQPLCGSCRPFSWFVCIYFGMAVCSLRLCYLM